MAYYTNNDVADFLTNIGDLLEIKGENHFKVRAYRQAAQNIAGLGQNLYEMWQADQNLKKVEGIGAAIADKLDEWFRTGELEYWNELTAEVPASLVEVVAIPDVGPKTAKTIWQELGLTTRAEVKEAAQAGQLRDLPRMGKKTEARILASIEALERRQTGRVHLGIAWPLARQIVAALEAVAEAEKVAVGGSMRRWRETVGDLDLLVATSQPGPVTEAFTNLDDVAEVLLSGETKTSIRFHNGMQADLRCLQPKHWGTALQYFTGNQPHNIKIRELAQKQGYSLNEYALTRLDDEDEKRYFDEEAALYEFLGLAYIPPLLRQDRGELAAVREGNLPDLPTVADIKGEVHCHSTWSDGAVSIEAMARRALERGYAYLSISDHSQSLGVANGLTPDRLREQRAEIEAVQEKLPDIRLFQGIELEIKADGSLDFPDEVLAELDFVVASIHTSLRQDRETLTRRALNAIHNPHVKLIGHPTGRLLTTRDGGDFDMEAIFKAAAETGTMLEVNAAPERLDLRDAHVRRALEHGVKLMINCDAHHPDEFENLVYGVATAGRGWATAADIINTRPLDEFMAYCDLT